MLCKKEEIGKVMLLGVVPSASVLRVLTGAAQTQHKLLM